MLLSYRTLLETELGFLPIFKRQMVAHKAFALTPIEARTQYVVFPFAKTTTFCFLYSVLFCFTWLSPLFLVLSVYPFFQVPSCDKFVGNQWSESPTQSWHSVYLVLPTSWSPWRRIRCCLFIIEHAEILVCLYLGFFGPSFPILLLLFSSIECVTLDYLYYRSFC